MGAEAETLRKAHAGICCASIFGRLVALRYEREHARGTTRCCAAPWVSACRPGESLPMPDAGVVASVQFDELDLDAWRKVAAAPVTAGAAPAAPAGGPPLPAALRGIAGTASWCRARTLRVGGQKFGQLVAGGTREARTWRVDLDARELAVISNTACPRTSGQAASMRGWRAWCWPGRMRHGVEHLLDEQPGRHSRARRGDQQPGAARQEPGPGGGRGPQPRPGAARCGRARMALEQAQYQHAGGRVHGQRQLGRLQEAGERPGPGDRAAHGPAPRATSSGAAP